MPQGLGCRVKGLESTSTMPHADGMDSPVPHDGHHGDESRPLGVSRPFLEPPSGCIRSSSPSTAAVVEALPSLSWRPAELDTAAKSWGPQEQRIFTTRPPGCLGQHDTTKQTL